MDQKTTEQSKGKRQAGGLNSPEMGTLGRKVSPKAEDRQLGDLDC